MDTTKYTNDLCKALQQSCLAGEEKEYRMNKLKKAERMNGSKICAISDQYFSLAHEIRSLEFLEQFGTVVAADDKHSKAGCDYVLNGKYQIECVCSTAGDTEKNQLAKFSFFNTRNKVIDGEKKRKIIYSRLTSSIKSKLGFYQEHVSTGTMRDDLPYIIFLGLGCLCIEMILNPDKYGIEFNGIFLGKGKPEITIDIETREFINYGYSFEPTFENHNGSLINSAIFCSEEYADVSGILASGANSENKYTFHNTWLFINPNARIKIEPEDFSGITYWDEDDNMMYKAYRDGFPVEP